MRFITRMPDGLWRVWVMFGTLDCGQIYFGDAAYGGLNSALRKALKCRDDLIREHNIPLREYAGNGWCAKHAKNTSGEVGIALEKKPAIDPYYVAWAVRNMVDGKQWHRSWSIKKYGYLGAWRLATEARVKHTGQPTSEAPPAPPDWLVKWARERSIDLFPE